MVIFPFAFVDRIVNPILSKYVGLCVCVGLMGESFLSCFFFLPIRLMPDKTSIKP